jgi:uncharacterized membrane protein
VGWAEEDAVKIGLRATRRHYAQYFRLPVEEFGGTVFSSVRDTPMKKMMLGKALLLAFACSAAVRPLAAQYPNAQVENKCTTKSSVLGNENNCPNPGTMHPTPAPVIRNDDSWTPKGGYAGVKKSVAKKKNEDKTPQGTAKIVKPSVKD